MPTKPTNGSEARRSPRLADFFEELPYAVMAFSGAIICASVAAIAIRVAVYAITGI